MPTPVTQPGFNGGELAPSLYSRVDLDRYRQSLKRCENFVVSPHGGVQNRPGTRYIAATKEQSKYVRLVTFAPSAEEQYVLEFGPLYLRIYDAATGQRVVDDAGVPIELVTPYTSGPQDDLGTASVISRLNFTQSVDVMTIVHPEFSPRELKRSTLHYWTLDTLTTFVNRGYPTSVSLATPLPSGSPKRDWQWAVSGVSPDGVESLAVLSPVTNVFIASTSPVTLLITIGELVDHFVVYKGLDGTYGFVGSVKVNAQASYTAASAYKLAYDQAYENAIAAGDGVVIATALAIIAGQAAADAVSVSNGIVPGVTQFTFKDDNIAPDYTDQPRQAVNPFTPTGGLKPACVSYFQQRLVFANVQGKPDTLYLSEVADYKNFQRQIPTAPDDSIVATIASSGLNEIRALAPLRHLLVFTAGAEYLFGAEKGAVTPDDADAVPQSYWGSSSLQPLLVGNVVLFKDIGGHIREWVYDQNENGYPASDVGKLANHLFVDSPVIEWAYVSSPSSVVWAVRADGMLLSFTYVRDQSVAGWARHTTQGKFRSVCSARRPSAEGESLWAVVDRTLNGVPVKLIETIDPWSETASPFSDSSIAIANEYPGVLRLIENTDPGANGGWTKGKTIIVYTPDSQWSAALADIVSFWFYTADGTRLHGIMTGIVDFSGIGSSSYALVELGVDVPDALRVSGTEFTNWSLASKRFGLFTHLIGETVQVVADGLDHPNVVVDSGGAITLVSPATRVTVGLAYESIGTTLALTYPQTEIRAKQKLISQVDLFVNATRGLFVGPEGGELTEAKTRAFGTPPSKTGLVTVRCSSKWETNGSITFKQTYPLPCEVLGIAPEVTIGG